MSDNVSQPAANDVVLEIRNLKKYFPIEKGILKRTQGYVRAVEDFSLTVRPGAIVALVGESGCGKTTVGRCMVKLQEPTSGSILYHARENEVVNLSTLSQAEMKPYRKDIQIMFQDPYASLDPRMSVFDIISEPLRYLGYENRVERVRELLENVGLDMTHLNRYPHAFSGGQCRCVAVALAPKPRLIVADEPVSALDVSIQAQVINLLERLQQEHDLTFLLIAHDLSVVQHLSNSVAVMYVGLLVEHANTNELFSRPLHPYTEALLSAVPSTDLDRRKKRIVLSGDIANPADPPSGCYFHPRCPYRVERCIHERPELRQVFKGHHVACHRAEELELWGSREERQIKNTATEITT